MLFVTGFLLGLAIAKLFGFWMGAMGACVVLVTIHYLKR